LGKIIPNAAVVFWAALHRECRMALLLRERVARRRQLKSFSVQQFFKNAAEGS